MDLESSQQLLLYFTAVIKREKKERKEEKLPRQAEPRACRIDLQWKAHRGVREPTLGERTWAEHEQNVPQEPGGLTLPSLHWGEKKLWNISLLSFTQNQKFLQWVLWEPEDVNANTFISLLFALDHFLVIKKKDWKRHANKLPRLRAQTSSGKLIR